MSGLGECPQQFGVHRCSLGQRRSIEGGCDDVRRRDSAGFSRRLRLHPDDGREGHSPLLRKGCRAQTLARVPTVIGTSGGAILRWTVEPRVVMCFSTASKLRGIAHIDETEGFQGVETTVRESPNPCVVRLGSRNGVVPVGVFSRFLTKQHLRRTLEIPGIRVLQLELRQWLVLFVASQAAGVNVARVPLPLAAGLAAYSSSGDLFQARCMPGLRHKIRVARRVRAEPASS